MGNFLEPSTKVARSAPTPAFSLLISKKALLDASRTEILILASGILFLASQVCLLVRFFSGRLRAAPAAGKKEQRKVAIVLPPETTGPSPISFEVRDTNGDSAEAIATGAENSELPPLLLCRSSTWSGGHAAHSSRSHPRERRKSAGSRLKAHDRDDDDDDDGDGTQGDEAPEKLGAKTSLSSPGPELEPLPEVARATPVDSGDKGRLAVALATPATVHLPLGHNASGGGTAAEATELREFGSRPGGWREAGLLGASIEAKKPGSPRSPRVLAADQATMMDALCAEEGGGEEGGREAAGSSPVDGVRRDSLGLGLEFDGPRGVTKKDTEAVELESRGGRDS